MSQLEEAWVVFGYSLVGLSCTALVVVASSGGRLVRVVLANPVVAYIGKVSYGIYLWHCLLALIVISIPWEVEVVTRMGVWVAVVVGVATVSWYGIERVWLGGMKVRAS